MNCPKCNKEVKDTWNVCPFCMQLLSVQKCTVCGAEVKLDWKACPKCGTLVGAAAQPAGSGKTAETDNSPLQAGSKKTLEVKGVAFDFCWIPPGEFLMGSEDEETAKPMHVVQISKGFWMGRTPVTQRQWQALMDSNPSKFKNRDDHPVENVSWDDCQKFIGRMNQLANRRFRLPTEAQWEYACRAGTTGEYYGLLDEIGWYKDNSNGSTKEVAKLKANAWGLYDMLGNVMEWCQDWYDYSDAGWEYYAISPLQDPQGPISGSYRVCRGSYWGHIASSLYVAYRTGYDPGLHYHDGSHGFRLVMEL